MLRLERLRVPVRVLPAASAQATLAVCVLAALVALARADDPPATAPAEPATQPAEPARDEGWIAGTVLDPDGAIKPDLEIRAERMDPIGAAGGGGPTSRRPGIVRTTTNETGSFTLRNLDPGRVYTVVGGSNEVGWVYEEVTPEAGKVLKLGQLKMFRID
jgi:hypothetical protein